MIENRKADLFVAFACGALMGSAVAVLMAPASGADTRRRMRAWGRMAGDQINTSITSMKKAGARLHQEVEGIRESARGEARRIKHAVHEGADAYRRSHREAVGSSPEEA